MKKIFTTVVLLFLLVPNIWANHIVFTDLREALKNPKEVYILNLSNQSYPIFPMQILELENLHELILNNTQMTYLPNDIDKLKHLTTLRVQKNPIRQIPTTIVHLTHLKVLDMRETEIVRIPDISTLHHLVEIDISNTFIKQVPPYFYRFLHLKHLEIAGLRLTHFVFSKYKHLHYLDISDNHFEQLPNDLKEVTHLHTLIAKNLKNLKTVPLWLFDLPHLHHLDMSNNSSSLFTSEHWEKLSSDKHLKGLVLANVNLPNLSLNWNGLKHLEELDLSGNPMIDYSQLVNGLSDLPLKKLNLSGNQLKTIDMNHLKHINYLNLSNNKLTKFPTCSSTIHVLNLEGNFLKEISNSITELNHLEELYLASNQIQDINILFQTSLKRLTIHHNPISVTVIRNLKNKQPLCKIE